MLANGEEVGTGEPPDPLRSPTTMRKARACAAAAALVALLAGCGSSVNTATPGRTPSPDVLSPGGDPEALVKTWTVAEPAASAGDIVIFGDELELFLDCGLMFGAWRANKHGMLVASETGGDGSCFENNRDPWPDWFSADAFRIEGEDAVLLDRDGQPLARLQPGGHPTTGPNDSPEFASPPVLTPALRKSLDEPAPLPDDVMPATRSDVLGRWLPLPTERPDGAPRSAFVAFDESGTYKGSDGCNGDGGRYELGEDGLILATTGVSTAVGCNTSPLSSWPYEAGRLGTRGDHLVFVDPTGKIMGEAVRG